MKKTFYIYIFLLMLLPLSVQAETEEIVQVEENDIIIVNAERTSRWSSIKDYTSGILKSAAVGIEYRVKAGLAIGGTSPIPVPLEIQEITGFNPLLNAHLEGEVLKMFDDAWGLSFGLRLESKGMKTDARVKNYNMKMVAEDGELAGRWTGMVETKVNNVYLTLPVLAVWRPAPRWGVKLGAYGSYLLSGHFSGAAYDGYLRVGDPTGEKVNVTSAIYNFSDDLRSWAWGVQLGGEWRAFPHLIVSADLTWGMNSIFGKDFEVITFNMYPIYGSLSFGYAF